VTRYRVLIVDDEPPARANVARLLSGDPRFEVVGEAVDGVDALEQIRERSPDLVVLDVQMPGLDGFDVLRAAGRPRAFVVVFSTAYERHAVRAFDLHAVDYLLKPYAAPRFHRALDRAHARLRAGMRSDADLERLEASLPPKIVVKTDEGWVSVLPSQVFRVSAAGKYVVLTTGTGRHVVRESLSGFQRRLPASSFVRVHRGEIVNVDEVERVEPGSHGDGRLVLADGAEVPLSRTYRAHFLERFRPLR